jgi:hypothetical protein
MVYIQSFALDERKKSLLECGGSSKEKRVGALIAMHILLVSTYATI